MNELYFRLFVPYVYFLPKGGGAGNVIIWYGCYIWYFLFQTLPTGCTENMDCTVEIKMWNYSENCRKNNITAYICMYSAVNKYIYPSFMKHSIFLLLFSCFIVHVYYVSKRFIYYSTIFLYIQKWFQLKMFKLRLMKA